LNSRIVGDFVLTAGRVMEGFLWMMNK